MALPLKSTREIQELVAVPGTYSIAKLTMPALRVWPALLSDQCPMRSCLLAVGSSTDVLVVTTLYRMEAEGFDYSQNTQFAMFNVPSSMTCATPTLTYSRHQDRLCQTSLMTIPHYCLLSMCVQRY